MDRKIVSGNGVTALRLGGTAKQRRLARETIQLVATGGDVDDVAVRCQGAVVIPHSLEHPGKKYWLSWRLKAVEYDTGMTVEINRHCLYLIGKSNDPNLEEGSENRL